MRPHAMFVVALMTTVSGVVNGEPIVVNPGFEEPAELVQAVYSPPFGALDPSTVPGWVFCPSEGGATSGAYGGIYQASSESMGHTLTGHVGEQVGFLEVLGSFYQDIAGFAGGGDYTVSFLAAGRMSYLGGQEVKVTLDGTSLTFSGAGTVLPTSTTFALYTSDVFTTTTGTHRLAFTGLNEGDYLSYFDSVSVNQVPEPSVLSLFVVAGVAIFAYARRSRK